MNDIEIKKKLSKIKKECRENAKSEHCVICNKKVTSFCNSHSIPKFVLKNIEEKGLVYTANHFFELPIEKEEKGIIEAGTFHIICNECDNTVFQDYENIEALLQEPNNKIMAEMTLKNTLIMIGKRNFEIQLFEKMKKEYSHLSERLEYFNQKNDVNQMDLDEFNWEYRRAKKIIDKNLKSGYKLMFWVKLDYIVPIASQGHICIYSDLNGNIINDIYNYNPKKRLHYMNLNIFPLENCSVISMYYHKDDNTYHGFDKQFNRLNLDEQLQLISFLLVNYTEEFYMSKNVSNDIIENEKIKQVSKNIPEIMALNELHAEIQKEEQAKEILQYKDFPNILSKEYAI